MMNINTVAELKKIRPQILNGWLVGENRFNEAVNWDIIKEIFTIYENFNNKWLTKAVRNLMKEIKENCQTVTWKHIRAVKELCDEIEVGLM